MEIAGSDRLTDAEAGKLKGIFKNDHAVDALYEFVPEGIMVRIQLGKVDFKEVSYVKGVSSR